ncbi:MAG: hypothetical protein K6F39_09395 [Lachnospiraceae bacterium]|nr:hypothetical protein [Lachnospiraceae bacterium]
MMLLSENNEFSDLSDYDIDYRNDYIKKWFPAGEDIRYSYSNGEVKLFISNRRVIVCENEVDTADTKVQYTVIGFENVDYLQFEICEISRKASGAKITLWLRSQKKLSFSFAEEVDVSMLQMFFVNCIK